MSTNEQLLEKADIAVSDLTNDGGKLNDEQANTFIRTLLVQPTMLRQARSVVMNAPTRKINKIKFADRILMPATQGVALDADTSPTNRRSKATTDQISLTTKEYIAEVRLPYDVIEDNIERGNIGLSTDTGGSPTSGGIADTIMAMIGERAALDLEELAINGDEGDTVDDYLDSATGWLARFTSNQVNASTAPISRALLSSGMKALPSQYRRNRAALRHFVSHEKEIDYRETIAQRETGQGDSMTTSTAPVFAAASPVEGAALMPDTKGLLTNPLNLIWGIQRQIHVETDKDIRTREYIIVLTIRCDFQVEEELAGVLTYGMSAS